MTLLIGAATLGLLLSLLAFGVYISFRLFEVADITVDGSVTLGAAVVATLLVKGWDPLSATLVATLAGAAAGLVTGFLQTKCGINALLSGILVMTGLYSVNLRVMGKSNVSLNDPVTRRSLGMSHWAEDVGQRLWGDQINFFGWILNPADILWFGLSIALVTLVALVLYWFFRTDYGTALRASGDNPQMVRALGVSVDGCRIIGLALANGLVGLCGALWCQYQDFADAQMGIGMIVWGLASVIIGEALTGTKSIGYAIVGTIIGSVLFRLVIAITLRYGLAPSDFKFVYAFCLFIALVMPRMLARLKRRPAQAA